MKEKIIEILEQRIKDLERIIAMQDDIIKYLRKPKIDFKQSNVLLNVPFISTICDHEYSLFPGAVLRHCVKCYALEPSHDIVCDSVIKKSAGFTIKTFGKNTSGL